MSILFITHDFGVVEYLSDRTVVMHNGQIVEAGDTEQVCQRPSDPYTKKLLEAVPRLEL